MNRMRNAAVAVMLLGSLSAAACPNVDRVGSASSQVVLNGTRALIVAEYAYNSAGQFVLPLLLNGTIKGADATRVRKINRDATALLVRAKTAKTDIERASIASELMSAVVELNKFRN